LRPKIESKVPAFDLHRYREARLRHAEDVIAEFARQHELRDETRRQKERQAENRYPDQQAARDFHGHMITIANRPYTKTPMGDAIGPC